MRQVERLMFGVALLACGGGAPTAVQGPDAQAPKEGGLVPDSENDTSGGDGAGDAAAPETDAGPDGSAPFVPVPIPDEAGATRKLVFVTSAWYTADLGGLAGADAKCQTAAVAASLPGTYKAWLGDSTTDAVSRLTHAAVPYELVDGIIVANDWAELLTPADAMLVHAIDETERGRPPPRQPLSDPCYPTAWTGAYINSSKNGYGECSDWTSAQDVLDGGPGGGSLGNPLGTNLKWRFACYTYQCSMVAPLYCFEQ